MAELLGDQALVAATGDAFKSSRLELMLSNLTASYKLYWLKGVFDEVLAGNVQMSFERIAARMIASAWYPVTYFKLNLGATDMLARAVAHAQLVCGLEGNASEESIVDAVASSYDSRLRRFVKDLYSYVPYRIIRPFYGDWFDAERALHGAVPDHKVNGLVARFNRDDAAGAPYHFNDALDGLEVEADWSLYFRENRHVIRGWLDMKLVSYLQMCNPSVPAIPLKIYPPVQRDLSAARSYWEEALADHTFREIYSGIAFDAAGYSQFGPLSVDHFVPWSFVLHDEPWNLAPMFRDLNSSKGSKLPLLEEALQPFCSQQFDALMTLRDSGRHKKIFEAYSNVDSNILAYERTDSSLASFSDSLGNVIVPLHQIASNQGFSTWRPSVSYAVVGA